MILKEIVLEDVKDLEEESEEDVDSEEIEEKEEFPTIEGRFEDEQSEGKKVEEVDWDLETVGSSCWEQSDEEGGVD